MNPIPALTPHLKQLRLSGILDSLEARNRQAIEGKMAYTEFLALLIEDEEPPGASRRSTPRGCAARRSAPPRPWRDSTSRDANAELQPGARPSNT